MSMNEKAFHAYELGLIVSRCCRDLDLEGAFSAYKTAVEFEAVPSSETFCNLLSLTAGLGEQGSGQALVRETEPPHNLTAALTVYEGMLRHNVIVPESSYTALIRCCCINQQPFRGLQFYRDMQKLSISPKLRTFTSLLDALSLFSARGNHGSVDVPGGATTTALESGFTLYEEIVGKYGLELTEKEYLYMLRLCLAEKDRRFYDILKTFGETGIVPVSEELRTILKDWFSTVEKDFIIEQSLIAKNGTVEANGEQLRSLDVDEQFREEFVRQLESFAVDFDETKRIKVNNKIKEQQQIKAMKALLQQEYSSTSGGLSMDTSESKGSDHQHEQKLHQDGETGNEKKLSKGGSACSRQELWTDFVKYLRFHMLKSTADSSNVSARTASTVASKGGDEGGEEEREQERARAGENKPSKKPRYEEYSTSTSTSTSAKGDEVQATNPSSRSAFNIIVDGANVGYFKQNYLGAPNHVNYQQIDQLLHHLRALGHKPLLILHSRHVSKFMVPNEECADIVRRWRSDGCLYATPKSFNDDWFWLYAAVAHRCKVVTNDEMRDHHFQLLSPKWFNRWRERNRVQFTFGQWQDQQLKQQQRSVISGSSNSNSNSATLRALQYMPVNLTSDLDRDHPVDCSVVVESRGVLAPNSEASADAPVDYPDSSSSSSDDEDSAAAEQHWRANRLAAKELKKAQMKRVSLRWPSTYSYCLQHVRSQRWDGYYCPPAPAPAPLEGELHQKDALDAGVFGVPSDKAKNEWLCVYRPLS